MVSIVEGLNGSLSFVADGNRELVAGRCPRNCPEINCRIEVSAASCRRSICRKRGGKMPVFALDTVFYFGTMLKKPAVVGSLPSPMSPCRP